MQNLADKMRAQSEAVSRRQQRVADKALRTAEEQRKADYQNALTEGKSAWSVYRQKIKEAARAGEFAISENIFQWAKSSALTEAQRGRRDGIKEEAEKHGFKFEMTGHRMDPVGSDPMFDETRYDIGFLISWGTE